MRMIPAIGVAAFVAAGLYSLGQWMRAQVVAWERAQKNLTQADVLFVRVMELLVNYWYVPAIVVFFGTLIFTIASSRQAADDQRLIG